MHWRPGRTTFEGQKLIDGQAAPAGSVIPDVASGQDMTRVKNRTGVADNLVTYSADTHPPRGRLSLCVMPVGSRQHDDWIQRKRYMSPMPVEIKTTNTKELLQKKQDRLSALRASTQLPSADSSRTLRIRACLASRSEPGMTSCGG